MQEIEIKAVLRDKDGVMKKLAALNCTFSAPIRQEDAVYVENVGDLPTFLANKVFMRIRVNNGKEFLLTAKQRKHIGLVAEEHETAIESADEMRLMLEMMGFGKQLDITKTRIRTEHNGDEICIDEVEDLGSYIEMERLSPDGDPVAIQEELWEFFDSVGISRADRINRGYDILLLEKRRIPHTTL